jgi:DNA-directed RNA polymerase subunit alpha
MSRIETLELNEEYGKFVLEPIDRGFGQTIGNSLRRVLMGASPGVAVEAIKIEGVAHEFSAISGVKEDATQIILNLRELAIKLDPEFQGNIHDLILKIDVKGEGKITGADIQCPESVSVANPECYIASISDKDAAINMELYIGKATGYKLPDKHEQYRGIIGVIPVGSQYSPVKRVNYFAEPTRVGMVTDYFERLTLEVWTNGSVAPNDALTQGVQILDKYFKLFLEIGRVDQSLFVEETEAEESELANVPDFRIDDLNFSQRTYNCLRRANIMTLRQLAAVNEVDLNNIRGFGRKSLNEVRDRLEEYGIQLKTVEGFRANLDFDDEDDL